MAKQTTKATAPEVEEQPQTVATAERKMTLAAKLLHVKASIGKIGKDGSSIVGGKTAPAKTVKYATLPSILERIMPLLDHEGIDYTVSPVMSDAAISMMAQGIRIFSIHFTDVATGEVSEPICYPFMRASNPEPIKADGSTITYATRYLLGLALGLQTEEDPDAKMQTKQPQQPQQPAQQPQQQKKQRTFRECVNGFYATYNKGDLDGARRTLDFVRKNWGRAEECAAEIAAMEKLDLTVWQPTQPNATQQSAPTDANTAPF